MIGATTKLLSGSPSSSNTIEASNTSREFGERVRAGHHHHGYGRSPGGGSFGSSGGPPMSARGFYAASASSPVTSASPGTPGKRPVYGESPSSVGRRSTASLYGGGASPVARPANPPLVRTVSSEPAKVKIGFDVGNKTSGDHSSAKPPIGMLRAELAGDFNDDEFTAARENLSADVFDGEAYQRAMLAAPDVFVDPTVRSAYEFAARSHAGPGLGPHFEQCVDTAVALAKLGMDAQTISVGLLHDTLDVTSYTVKDLNAKFSGDVVDMVQGAAKVSRVSKLHRASGRALDFDERSQFRAMLLAMTDARVVIVNLAARLIKMRNLSSAPLSQQQAFADETLAIHAPLAARLGIFTVKNELEDLAFKWMNPQAYASIFQALGKRESIVAALSRLDAELVSRNVEVVDLCGRQKSVYSIFKKMLSKHQKIEDIMDVRAIRIILPDAEDASESERACREMLDLVHTIWTPVDGRVKDYIAKPKSNGYQSIHTVVRDETGNTLEVQVRTATMHRTAEFGVAAHWRYKENEKSPTSAKVDQQIQWARFMLTWQNELDDQQKIRPTRVANAVECSDALNPCMFPHHASDCRYHEANGGAFCRSCDAQDDSSNYIITVVDGAVAVRELKQGATLSDLKLQDEHIPGGARSREFYRISSVRVNKTIVDEAAMDSIQLRMGDVVEVSRSRISSPNKSWDETDDGIVFYDLNLQVHALKVDSVDTSKLHVI